MPTNDDVIMDAVRALTAQITVIGGRLEKIPDLSWITRQLQRLLDDTAVLKEDNRVVKAEIRAVRETMRTFETKLDSLDRKLDRVEDRLRRLEDVGISP